MQDRRDVTVERRTARARAGPAVVVARVAVPEPVGEDLVDHRPLQPGRRRERAVVDGQVEGVEWLPGRFPLPAFVDVRAAVVVAVPVDAARRLDAERVGDEGRLCRGPVRDRPERAAASHLQPSIRNSQQHALRLCSGNAQAQPDLRARGHGAGRGAVRAAEAVVEQPHLRRAGGGGRRERGDRQRNGGECRSRPHERPEPNS